MTRLNLLAAIVYAVGVFILPSAALGQSTQATNDESGIGAPVHPAISDAERTELHKALDALIDSVEKMNIDWGVADWGTVASREKMIQQGIGSFAGFASKTMAALKGDEQCAVLTRDFTTYLNQCAARLSGNIVRVGPNGRFRDLMSALPALQSGDCVLLEDGAYELRIASGPSFVLSDVAFVGGGPDRVTLKGQIQTAMRLRIEGATLDCNNDPFLDLRTGGSVHLKNCRVFNYNSGAGGSSAIDINDGALLVEGCVFQGKAGNAWHPSRGANNRFGVAFDIRGVSCLLYVRQTQFLDNDEIFRAGSPCVFDGCRMMNSSSRSQGVIPYAPGRIAVFDSPGLVTGSGTVTKMEGPSDRSELVREAVGPRQAQSTTSQETKNVAGFLRNRLPYWIGLLRHDDASIRDMAATRIKDLAGVDVAKLPDEQPAADEEPSIELSPPLDVERRYAFMMRWLEDHAASLKWDAQAKRYRMEEK